MDFFGFGIAADLSTPLGFIIKGATDALLPGPDWSKYASHITCSTTLSPTFFKKSDLVFLSVEISIFVM